MPKFVALTTPTAEVVHINADAVLNVHAVFKSEGWAKGTQTVIVYGGGYKVGVCEDVQTVLDWLGPVK